MRRPRRLMKRVAADLRRHPGRWRLVGYYSALYVAKKQARYLLDPQVCAAFQPAGEFEFRAVRDVDGEPAVEGRYLGVRHG
jgi:hypothetical protein